MRGLLLVLLLMGCSQPPTLDELEDEALRTGDWSEVIRREEKLQYELAMEAAQAYCRNEFHSRAVLWCIDMPRRQRIKDIYRYCSCNTAQ
jgi:uncharacterized protein HemY